MPFNDGIPTIQGFGGWGNPQPNYQLGFGGAGSNFGFSGGGYGSPGSMGFQGPPQYQLGGGMFGGQYPAVFQQGGPGSPFMNPQFANDPANNYNFFNNPQASHSQNRAFYIPDFEKDVTFLGNQADKYANWTYDQTSPFRQNQIEFIKRLEAAERGEGPSVAQEQLKMATNRNIEQAMAMRASMPQGQNVGLANRAMGSDVARMNQDAAGQSALTRLSEQLAAREQLGSAIENARDQDMQAEEMKNQMMTYFISQGLNLKQAQAQTRQALESLLAGQYQAAQALQAQYEIARAERKQNQRNALIGAGASIIGAIASGAAGYAGGPGQYGGSLPTATSFGGHGPSWGF